MMYLCGGYEILAPFFDERIGMMLSPAEGDGRLLCASIPYALDNGCFNNTGTFDAVRWMRWVRSHVRDVATCLFAVAPDVLHRSLDANGNVVIRGDAWATYIRGLLYLPLLRAFGFRTAFVSQDGCKSSWVPWALTDTLFVGGSTDWKLSRASWDLVAEAQRYGKRTHVGRVNSYKRLRLCADNGVDTVDGTFMARAGFSGILRMLSWFEQLDGMRA